MTRAGSIAIARAVALSFKFSFISAIVNIGRRLPFFTFYGKRRTIGMESISNRVKTAGNGRFYPVAKT
jgi:hypothetical protein